MTIISKIWLHLVKEGGRWTAPELAAALELKSAQVMSAVNAMYLRQYIQRHDVPGAVGGTAQYQYSVTAKCVTPAGLPLQYLFDAGLHFTSMETASV